MEQFVKLLPKLSAQLKKGDCGRIGVIGGSVEYTGAPYYAAASAARLVELNSKRFHGGADLIHVFCAPEAAPVLKGYSPDLIVHPGLEPQNVIPKLDRIHTLVLGPGLGRDERLWPLIRGVYDFVEKKQMPFVVDGDGLWFIAENISILPKLPSVVLTPNFVEFARLCKAALNIENVLQIEDHKEVEKLAIKLSAKLDVALYVKGKNDLVVTPNGEVSECSTSSNPRRCGGQGDVTAGTLGVLLYWAQRGNSDWQRAHHEAGVSSSWLVRTSGRRAFERVGRSMNTPDLLEEMPRLLREIETREPGDTVHS